MGQIGTHLGIEIKKILMDRYSFHQIKLSHILEDMVVVVKCSLQSPTSVQIFIVSFTLAPVAR